MIVVDTSALMAILREEADAATFVDALAVDRDVIIGAPTKFELFLVTGRWRADSGMQQARILLAECEAAVVPWTDALADLAAEAFLCYGRTRHRAALNFGDCMACAVAKSLDAPLLFKGDDFSLTDIKPVL